MSDVAIVGAGPYGLSIAAHLRGTGLDVRIFPSAVKSSCQLSPLRTVAVRPPEVKLAVLSVISMIGAGSSVPGRG